MEGDTFVDCLLLKKLLCPHDNKSDSDSEDDYNLPNNTRKTVSFESNEPKTEKKCSKNFEDEIKEAEDEYSMLHSKKRPDFSLVYKQYLATQDVYLQMDPTLSTSPKEIIIKINLPEENMTADMMELSITEMEIVLTTAIYHLKLPLVYKIDANEAIAKYDAENKILNLTLKIITRNEF